MRSGRVTLKDIADATGVHVSTVSRALSPNPSASITQEVIDRVSEAAQQMGYRPNLSAYSLRTNRTKSIGVLIPDITNLIFPQILRGIEAALEPEGYVSLIVNTDNQAKREASLLDSLIGRGVDGIIHAGALRDDILSGPRGAEALRVPLLTVNRRIDGRSVPAVVSDEELGIRDALQHLVDLGHRKISHVAGPQKSSTGANRRKAFLREARRLELDVPASAIGEAAQYVEAEGAATARGILKRNPGTTALLCANDHLALGALSAVHEAGLNCPGDISITGFNDMPMIDLIHPGITSVRINAFEVGRTAGTLMLKMLSGGKGVVPTQTVLPTELIVRGSTGPAKE